MALDRIGPTTRPLGIPDRPQLQPDPVTRAPDAPAAPELDYPVSPAGPPPIGIGIDGPDGYALPPPVQQGLAAALAADTPNAADPAAMHPNQVFLSRQLVWQTPDPATMATSWLVMVRTYAEQRAAWLEQANGRNLPASLFMTDHTPNSLQDGRPALPLVTEMEPWRFAVYAWGAEKLVLRVVVKNQDHTPEQRRRRARIALRLELVLAGLGRIVLQMEMAGTGVVLEVGATQSSALQHMREMLPQLASTVSRLGLTILRCRLMRELAPPSENVYPSRLQAASLPPVLFKAMAELAVLLSRPLPPDDLFSESA